MAIGTQLDQFGRPIDNSFFGGGGLGSALATLPGTPVLDGGTNVSNTPAPGSGQGIGTTTGGGGTPKLPDDPSASGRNTGETGGSRIPPPNPVAGVQQPGANFWGEQNPWAQNVGASINDQPVSFASPGNPNTNYVTEDAAKKLGSTFGANVVSQNLSNTASPGSSAPSAPMYALDFGRGDPQDAGMGAWQLARGDSPELVAQRYAAGLNNTGWGGPAPATARADSDGLWNYSTPISTNTPTAAQSGFFAPQPDAGAGQYARNLAGEGNYGQSSGSGADQAALIQWLRSQLGQA